MDAGTWRGLFTLLMLVIFIGVFVWAFSKKRKPDFDAAAQLPLEEDDLAPGDDTASRNTSQGAA